MNALSNTQLTVNVLTYQEQFAEHFARLNYEWLNEFFTVEPHDREQLDHPYEHIIKPGGQIFFAVVEEKVVGTVALVVEDPETYELAKMAVTSQYKGLKIGKKLMQEAIAYSRQAGKKRIVLESNTKLTPALNLYIKSGFVAAPLNQNTPYARCNIRMELIL